LDLRAECPSGAATIVTEQSFLNGLVGVLTIGIYTPQHVTVTCASGTGRALGPDADVAVAPGATAGERAEAFRQAVTLSIARHEPVTIRF
jgi:hypothetical protein